MRLFDGRDELEFSRHEDQLHVLLNSTQVRPAALDDIRAAVQVKEEGVPEGFQIAVIYPLPSGARSLAEATDKTKNRTDRLQLAQRLSVLEPLAARFEVPFLHPRNIVLSGEKVTVVHFGMENMMTPMSFGADLFLQQYKALILSIFNPKVAFDRLVDDAASLKDKFSQQIVACGSIADISELIDGELAGELAKTERTSAVVPKGRYRLFRTVSVVGVAGIIGLGAFTYNAYAVNGPRQNVIITAQSDFMANNYSQAESDLAKYKPGDLPKSARYVLAVSSINLTNLTPTQKQAVLNNVSTKSDDNTLNYWIYLARGDFDQSINLAQNLGDSQLLLLAYTDKYEAVKLNNSMDGAAKQQQLDDLSKKISDLSKTLGQSG